MSLVRVPVRLMRAGTSRGPVMRERDIPLHGDARDRMLERMLTGDGPRDGLGGDSPTERKVVIVFDPEPDGVVPYQVGSLDDDGAVDWSGTCGNMTASVLPFLSEETGEELSELRLRNVSTSGLIDATQLARADTGVWEVETAFRDPTGPITGSMLPVGSPRTILPVGGSDVETTIIDIAHPYVFLTRESFDAAVAATGDAAAVVAERIRGAAAVRAGLAASAYEVSPALPRIAVIDAVGKDLEGRPEIAVTAFSMGAMIDSVPVTCALCLAGGVTTPGTVMHVPLVEAGGILVVRAPSGTVIASVTRDGDRLASVGVRRTVRSVIAGIASVAC